MPKGSQEHLDARRRQILDGARRAFSRHGYEGATVTLLEGEIGLSRGAIHNYFPSKLELFLALATEDVERFTRDWQAGDWETLARRIAAEDGDWLGVYLEFGRLLRTDPSVFERWRARGEHVDAGMTAAMAEAQRAGLVRSDLPVETILTFLGVVLDGLAVRFSVPAARVDVEPLLQLARDAIAPK